MMNKQDIKQLALNNGFKLKEQPNGELDLNPYVYDFANALTRMGPKWVSIDDIDLKEGDEWLCILHGNRIVLTLGYETPTYEEAFKPYFFWYESTSDMLVVEWDDVEYVCPLPEGPAEAEDE